MSIIITILTSGLPCCIVALGIFLTYRLLDFADLTCEGSFLLGAVMTAVLIHAGWNPWLATLMACLIGGACGFVTGILNRVLKIPKLLAGIITLTASASIALWLMGFSDPNQSFRNQVPLTLKEHTTIFSMLYPTSPNGFTDWAKSIGTTANGIIESAVMLVIVILVVIAIYCFFGTEYGMAIRATGMNEAMAKANGINADIATVVAVSLSNALIGLGGSLFAQDALNVSAVTATGFLVIGLASILIGEAIFGKRSFKNRIISVTLGALVYFIIVTIAIRLGMPTELKNLLYAVLITIALCLPLVQGAIKKAIAKAKERKEATHA